MNTHPRLTQSARCRVIVDNDFSGDPDGLVGLVHHLLSPTNRVVAITSSFVNPEFPVPAPHAEDGAATTRELLEVVGGSAQPPVHAGSEHVFGSRSESAAADAIVREAQREADLPLYLVCGGPLTNVAQVLQQAPDIAGRLTLVWIGGALDPSAFEYNRDTDPAAAEFVLDHRELGIHQFPRETYRQCAYSLAELEHDIGTAGVLGQWLWTRFTGPHPVWVVIGGVWPLGDSPPVLVTALDVESSSFEAAAPESGGAARLTYTRVDFRLLVGDLLAKLRGHELQRTQEADQRESNTAR
jgi:purine nucleosidase